MSRGLGKMEVAILHTLEEAKATVFYYKGSAREKRPLGSETWRWDQPGWVRARGSVVLLAAGVYDLRASAKYLARSKGLKFIEGTFQPSFSRAVRHLVRRGELVKLSMVPLADVADPLSIGYGSVFKGSNGLFLVARTRQIRFVGKG